MLIVFVTTVKSNMKLKLFLCLFLISQNSIADAPKQYPFLSFDQGVSKAKQENKNIFLYFGRKGCGYCEKTNKKSFSNPILKKLYKKNLFWSISTLNLVSD